MSNALGGVTEVVAQGMTPQPRRRSSCPATTTQCFSCYCSSLLSSLKLNQRTLLFASRRIPSGHDMSCPLALGGGSSSALEAFRFASASGSLLTPIGQKLTYFQGEINFWDSVPEHYSTRGPSWGNVLVVLGAILMRIVVQS